MAGLYVGDAVSVVTTVLVLGLVSYLVVMVVRRRGVQTWGRHILAAIAVGTALSALSATRDAFMTDGALFALTSAQALICAVAGGVIYLLGFTALVVRKQSWRRVAFTLIAALLTVQLLTVEGTRIAWLLGAAL
jgi:hypothetical protein